MKKVIIIGGIYNIIFALFHCSMWKIFEWGSELKKLSITNSGIVQILNIQTIYYFIFTAVICFAFPNELQSTKLGKYFLAGTATFWLIRTIQQFIFYWTGNAAMFVMPAVFLSGAIIFLIPVFYKKRSITSK
ncbi:MAG: hypothetical protein LBQ60_06685 [Bacteroidales bacterium]|jgi:hypothetical protein|nr:hypothetical protein [Bacteroidales bacterium]